jgi:hypothetical protein
MAAKNLFSVAKSLENPKVASSPKTKTTIEGLQMYASCLSVVEWVNGIAASYRTQVQDQARELFLDQGMKTESQPASFDAEEGVASANIQCRKRSSASALTEIELDVLNANGIKAVEVKSNVETFVFNPELSKRIMNNPKLAMAISEALNSIDGIGEDPIQVQEATSKMIVGDDTIREVFKMKDRETVRSLMSIVCTQPAIRAKLEDGNVDAAIERVMGAK